MPVTPELEWEESEAEVVVSVGLPIKASARVDVVFADLYVRLSHAPYLLHLDLAHPIAEQEAAAVVSAGSVTLRLPKLDRGLWGALEAADDALIACAPLENDSTPDGGGSTSASATPGLVATSEAAVRAAERRRVVAAGQRARRAAAVARMYEAASAAEEAALKAERERERAAVQAQLDLDAEKRRRREERIARERHDAIEDAFRDAAAAVSQRSDDAEANPPQTSGGESETNVIPPPRKAVRVTVSFSKTTLPTPARAESNPVLPSDGVDLQPAPDADLRRIHHQRDDGGAGSTKVGDAPTSALLLKDKGDAFLKAGDPQAAVNAYRAALDLAPASIPVLLNLCAALLSLEHFDAAVEAATIGLDLLDRADREAATANDDQPTVLDSRLFEEAAAAQAQRDGRRIKLLVRRSMAQTRCGAGDAALADLDAALALDPSNASLQRDREAVASVLSTGGGE